MITTVNPDNERFKTFISMNIYVDKTLIIKKLNDLVNNDERNKICVSRPRRFGKTITTNLLVAYYSCGCDSRELFENTKLSKVEGWDKYLNKFNVIKLDIQGIYGFANETNTDFISKFKEIVIGDLIKQFPNIKGLNENKSLGENILLVYKYTNRKFVIIMDEYDVLVREQTDDKVLQDYLKLLTTLFKNELIVEAFALVYLTGIFPIIKDKIQSKLNNFLEFTVTSPRDFAGFIGFTENEVKDLCDKYNMDFNECKNWYDGYKMGINNSIYNPCSVIRAMMAHEFADYWSSTGSFESISDYLKFNIEGIYDDISSMVRDNSKIVVNVSEFLNRIDNLRTKDDILTYLINIGYLAYDEE